MRRSEWDIRIVWKWKDSEDSEDLEEAIDFSDDLDIPRQLYKRPEQHLPCPKSLATTQNEWDF